MVSLSSKKRIEDLKQKIALCDSFIKREIDIDFYQNQKALYEKMLESTEKNSKYMFKSITVVIFIFLFLLLFVLVYYILKQLIWG